MKNIKLLSINDENSLLMETNVMKALEKVNEPTTFKKIDNIEILKYGVLSFPALIINESIKLEGFVLSVEKLVELIQISM